MINPYNCIELKDTTSIETLINSVANSDLRPVVLIRCIAYNQGQYIEDALKSFVSQKTSFRFVALVHDDASEDNTPSIIMKYAADYPDIIIPVCDTVNRYRERTLTFVMDELINAFQPKYVAICEGDDYWIDDLKLQKQVDYMDGHLDCVMCHADYELTDGNKRKTQPHYDDEPFFGPEHKHTYQISSLTTMYRYETYKKIPNHRKEYGWPIGDYPLWIELSQEGSFHYIPEVFGKYRVLPNSASHSTDCESIRKYWNCRIEIEEYYSKLYGFEYKSPSCVDLYNRIQNQCYNNHDKSQAKKYWREAIENKACSLKSFLFYFCNVFNQRWIMKLIFRLLA